MDIYVNGWRLLEPRERRLLLMLAALIVCAGFTEIFALSSVSMLVPILIAPATVNKYGPLQAVIAWLGYADPRAAFPAVAAGASFLVALSLAFSYWTFIASLRFGNSVARRLSDENFDGCLYAPYVWHLGHSATTLAQRCFNDPEKIGKGFYPAALEQAYSLVLLLVGIVFLVLSSPWHNLISIAVIGLIGAAIVVVLKPRISVSANAARTNTLEISRLSVEALSAVKDLQVKMSQPIFRAGFFDLFGKVNAALEHVAALQRISHTVLTGIGQIGIIAIAVIMLAANTSPDEIATHLALLLLVLSRIVPALSRAVASLNSFATMRPYLNGVTQLRSELQQISGPRPDLDRRSDVPADWQMIDFADVGYCYPGSNRPALRDIRIELRRGGCYGLVGPSGSGKTTLSDILLGLLEATSGQLRVDGHDLNTFSHASWLRRIGYVPQAPYILKDTLRRNVAMGRRDDEIDDKKVLDALEQAGLNDLMASLEHGLDTDMGDRGSRLSGGQKQRLAIARALYQEPEVLILDEATSSLDALREKMLRDTIQGLRGRMTILIVAHRLQVITDCDCVFLLKQGELLAKGPFDELMKCSPLFAEMVKSAHIPTTAEHA